MATRKEIWDTLSKIDVSEHTEEKGNLTYLSWPWAWKIMKENYPQFEIDFVTYRQPDNRIVDVLYYEDGSCSVACNVKIDGCSEYMWLPVMDYRNNAIINPDARAISDAKQRCLVKCFALHGLGHYIYAGEDLPSAPSTESTQEAKPKKETTKNKIKVPQEDNEKGTAMAYSVFAEGCKTLPELHEFWLSNKDELIKMETTEPVLYQKVLIAFSNKKQQLTKEVKDA